MIISVRTLRAATQRSVAQWRRVGIESLGVSAGGGGDDLHAPLKGCDGGVGYLSVAALHLLQPAMLTSLGHFPKPLLKIQSTPFFGDFFLKSRVLFQEPLQISPCASLLSPGWAVHSQITHWQREWDAKHLPVNVRGVKG